LKSRGDSSDGDRGAVLILALVYIIAVSLVVGALSTLAMNNLNNSPKFSSTVELDSAASNMTQVAIQYVRYNPVISTSQTPNIASPLVACWGGDSIAQLPPFSNTYQIAVWCSTVWNPLLSTTRVVTFYACPISLSAAQCENSTLLESQVTFDDYPSSPLSAPIQTLCTVLCGRSMSITSWIWGSSSGGAASAAGIASKMSFTTEPSDTVVQTTTSAAVTVLDANGNPVAGDTVTLLENSGPGSGLATGTSTMTAVTNTYGIASFTNLVPQIGGNYTLKATDLQATPAVSSNFVVSKLANVITPASLPTQELTTSPPIAAPTATALSGDTVAIAVDSSSLGICSLSGGNLTFGPSAGMCKIDYTDPGNNVYASILSGVQQSINVIVQVTGTYSGSSNSSALTDHTAYVINAAGSGNPNSRTANGIPINTGTTLTKLTYTISGTNSTTFTGTVGEYTGSTWTATGLTCTITGGSGKSSCSITLSQSISTGYSINLYSSGVHSGISGSWTVSYTQP
jgi:hypothetical protein